jgi:hypothetical protein
VSVLIIGATLAGIGLAYADKDRTLAVERTSGPGQEFIPCFHPGTPVREAASELGRALREELVGRNLLSGDGRLHLGALAPVLLNRIAMDGLRIRFLTEVVNVELEQTGDYLVTLFDASGLWHILAHQIVDTTSTCLSSPELRPVIASKTINAMLHNVDTQAVLPVVGDGIAEVLQGRFPGEVILKLRVDADDDMPAARNKLHRYWAGRGETFGAWTLGVVADTMEVRTAAGPHAVGERRIWLPSCAYDNALQSFEAGFAFGKEGIRHETFSTHS